MSKTKKSKEKPLPHYVEREDRCSFGIAWFATEAEALDYEERRVRRYNLTYNGGWFHGMPCGRDRQHDKKAPDGSHLYAVTD